MIGVALAYRAGQHVAITLFADVLPRPAVVVLRVLSHLLTLLKPDTTYEVMVQAVDRADRASRDALSISFHTRAVTRSGSRGSR